MKFSEIEYKRPDLDEFCNNFKKILNDFNSASTANEQIDVISAVNNLRMEFQSLNTLASIKYSIDTFNKQFEEEQIFFDINLPRYEECVDEYYELLIKSPFRKELEEHFGVQLFSIAEVAAKTFKPVIMDDLKAENELRTEYTKLLASAKIFFDGEERNLAGLGSYMQSTDREVRKAANEAKWNFFSENAEQFDRIFDDLVIIRHRMAKKLGYNNFIQMGYDRMGRKDYDAGLVSKFRNYVHKYIVPISVKLKQRQQKRLGIENLMYYDQPLDFKSGNAKPHGSPEWIVSCATNMYSELSPETRDFFNYMQSNEMMDLVTKQGKDTGGYCTFIEKYRSPFIFSNFNGTSGDIEVLTHEAGHAFQAFSSRNFDLPEYFCPTAEACEIHSMSMEYLTWPWMNCFFKEQTEKFKYSHLKSSLIFVPYGVSVDEFQHWIYEHPEATSAVRKKAWIEVEKKYLPYINYDGNEYLESGGRWQQQRHIYMMPFYYIDYCLAQICAFQFWKKSLETPKPAFDDYLRLCKAGGSKSFLELVKLANLISPFEENALKSFVSDVEIWLDNFNDLSVN
ncbi:M3 family oligoendopeptidase [Candidatus Roizmanbacteria bacterium]|nr:M3 family oligoendopeptidase [Candidatus Roizmanbacteria bacterium]